MFYKPKFCCNCGEKIERIDWRLWTSRRFCSVCEIEQKGYELLPKAVVGTALLFGIFGLGSSLYDPGSSMDNRPAGLPTEIGSKRNIGMEPKSPAQVEPGSYKAEIERTDIERLGEPVAVPHVPASSKEQPRIRKIASDEPIHFCGAMTKKGKPCSRRVKSEGRCWQHAGQPSVMSSRDVPDIY